MLLQQVLKIENLPERLRELILNRAEGNPFFVEELVRSLIDARVIVLQEGRAMAVREIQAVEIPETLQGVLAARIDRLPAENKQALQRAAVIRRIFQQRVLAYIYEEKARPKLRASLGELQRREFIQSREQGASETAGLERDEYIFKHAITHDVAYGSMLIARRKELHQQIAEAIETLFPGRIENSRRRWASISSELKPRNGPSFILDAPPSERRRPSPMPKPLALMNQRSG